MTIACRARTKRVPQERERHEREPLAPVVVLEVPYSFRTVGPSRMGLNRSDEEWHAHIGVSLLSLGRQRSGKSSTGRTVADVARENGLVAQTLGNWVNAWRVEHAGDEPELNLTERARLKELEREVRELRMANEFLGKATAFFAKKSR